MVSNQVKGTVITIAGVLCLTPDPLLVRLTSEVPNMTVICYRFALYAVTCLIIFLLTYREESLEKVEETGKIGAIAGVVLGASEFLITYAFQTTAAANVLVILAASPLFTAIFSWLLFRETVLPRTIFASIICLGAIVLICSTQLAGDDSSNVGGLLCAIGASVTMALYFSLLRLAATLEKPPDFLLCNIVSGVFIVIIALIIGSDFTDVTGHDFLFLCLQGVVVLPTSLGLLTIAPSLIPAPEVSLLLLLQTVLSPIWVWLAGYESPPLMAVYGGIALIVALTVHSILAIREEQHKQNEEGKQGGSNPAPQEALPTLDLEAANNSSSAIAAVGGDEEGGGSGGHHTPRAQMEKKLVESTTTSSDKC